MTSTPIKHSTQRDAALSGGAFRAARLTLLAS
jgi:hypothetical protein